MQGDIPFKRYEINIVQNRNPLPETGYKKNNQPTNQTNKTKQKSTQTQNNVIKPSNFANIYTCNYNYVHSLPAINGIGLLFTHLKKEKINK